MNNAFVRRFDRNIIHCLKKISVPTARIVIFIVFFWFGILKVLGTSPADPLVSKLLSKTLPFITFQQFIIFFGIFEMAIGIIFLIPKWERIAIVLLFLHIVTTIIPLILLPTTTWQSAFVPTLEGQYIIKNLAIIALAIGIASHIKPFNKS
ncbi:MAG: hypothetical protein CO184_00575 [Candidatus Zambryskibacteria bacterium CG_4_9_14_3_um_filter_40_16]|uniref:Doxx family protein n=2 Tax=Candidatus Zambryskiibacteriota TaxID=1817925 RepID=A0A2H0K7H5_9BACT|nr:MAG: hypothetical protein COV95_00045 [Candidatus Zambryskibacteria bacterium CG11_big_fil_rev_8_21_14_0_20_40_24]PJA34148.1 MAG: hypothetical protein CO184_00575 [Candidatus Zambryskibacteria bacterium CG_4_9_14_3_um_filter_40_16]